MPSTPDAKRSSNGDQPQAPASAKDTAAAGNDVVARCDSASSTHATAFLSWAKEQSSSRRMSVEQFVQQHCSAASCKQPLDSLSAMGLEDVLAAAAAASAAEHHVQQPESFAPHDGWLRGPPKPACHEARIVAADGINSLRQTRDGEIGA
jgi:hypothetical protein